jgi:hypothetical protein
MDPDLVPLAHKAAAAVAGAVAARPLLEKLLGPSFAYVGDAMAALLERYGNRNVTDIFKRVSGRLPDHVPAGEYINPRVLQAIIEAGAFAGDEVTREYLAGLLATSLTPDGADDRAVTFLSIVRNLSSRQIRFHHLCYSLLRLVYLDDADQKAFRRDVFIPNSLLKDEVGIFTDNDLRIVLRGLSHEGLVDKYESTAHYYEPDEDCSYYGAVLHETEAGAELFLWVHGQPDAHPQQLYLSSTKLVGWSAPSPRPRGVCGRAALTAQAQAVHVLQEVLRELESASASYRSAELEKAIAKLEEHQTNLPQVTRHWLSSRSARPPMRRSEYLRSVRAEVERALTLLLDNDASE